MCINGVELENEEIVEIDMKTAEQVFPDWNSEKGDKIYVYVVSDRNCIQYAIIEKGVELEPQNIDFWEEEMVEDLEK